MKGILRLSCSGALILSWLHLAAPQLPASGLEIRVVPRSVEPGKALVVWIHSVTPVVDGSLEFLGRTVSLFPLKGSGSAYRYRAFLGVALEDAPGTHPLALRGWTQAKRPLQGMATVHVKPGEYPQEWIQIPEEKRPMLAGPDLREEAVLLQGVLERASPAQGWSGAFLMPVDGRVTSPFGLRRIYNDGVAAWQHKGVDLSGSSGTPVRAPNGAKVVLSKALKVHGNTVVLDHGQGVFSVLNHLQDLLVNEGHRVKKGHLVGHVGSTGMATGPHLHWGLSVGGVRVDPMPWVRTPMDRLIEEEAGS